ncbi:uncharacterized protein [Dendropsophus ebraccatus]|uniref:uncharacterized protein n=1 Tax=Dendropsophus ebraccatus TaxID=150705 RepID=UPI0038314EF1
MDEEPKIDMDQSVEEKDVPVVYQQHVAQDDVEDRGSDFRSHGRKKKEWEDWESDEDIDHMEDPETAEKINEEFENWVWKMRVMDTPWMFRKGKFPLHTWTPSLETIIEVDEEEEKEEATDIPSEVDNEEEEEAADIPREEEEEEDKATTVEIPRSSSRRSILSR